MNTTKTILAIGGTGAVLLGCCLALRGKPPAPAAQLAARAPFTVAIERGPEMAGQTRAPNRPSDPSVDPDGLLDALAPETPAVKAVPPDFWEELASFIGGEDAAGREKRRNELLDRTAHFLSLEGSPAAYFKAVSIWVVAELECAWRVRDASMLRLSDESPEAAAAIQDAYEGRKKEALARLEGAVGEGSRAEEFRGRLEEWIDAVR